MGSTTQNSCFRTHGLSVVPNLGRLGAGEMFYEKHRRGSEGCNNMLGSEEGENIGESVHYLRDIRNGLLFYFSLLFRDGLTKRKLRKKVEGSGGDTPFYPLHK